MHILCTPISCLCAIAAVRGEGKVICVEICVDCTGYPFDVPEAGASLLTYCCLVYHLPLVIAFSVRQRTSFVWGGCMLLPLADLHSDARGIMSSWSQVIKDLELF